MCRRNYRMGMIIVTVFVVSSINAAGDPKKEHSPRERRDKRDDELNRSIQLGYQKQESEEMSRQYHQQRESGWLEIVTGTVTLVGGYFGISYLWSRLFGKKSETETQSSYAKAPADKQPESVAPSDTAASAGSEGQPAVSSSDSSPQN